MDSVSLRFLQFELAKKHLQSLTGSRFLVLADTGSWADNSCWIHKSSDIMSDSANNT